MPRLICTECRYLCCHCVCQAITRIDHRTEVVILQHPSEVNHPKNTVKLLTLLLKQVEIVVGETSEDFKSLRERLLSKKPSPYVIFLTQSAIPLQEIAPLSADTEAATIVLIDGTWNKAKKIYYLNPWLRVLPCLRLSTYSSIYQVRKSNQKNSVSTLEATAYCLQHFENTDLAPFHKALNAMMQHHLKHRPTEVD